MKQYLQDFTPVWDRVEHPPRKDFKGFTLAEVLITLGIIGVVAALTVPTLMMNINSKQYSTAARVFEQKLNESLKTMNTQSTLAGHETTESFVEELSKHFKTNKICSNDKLLDCFSDVVLYGGGDVAPTEVDMKKIKNAKNFGQNDWGTNIVGVQFASGVSALIAYNPITEGTTGCQQDPYSNQVDTSNCLAILYDTTGAKNPNESGKDLRANKNVLKLGSSCALEIGGTCLTTMGFKPDLVTKTECEQLIAEGYGIEACNFDNDRWAGAVKHCGGVDKLPTPAQVGEIADYLYNTSGIGTSYKSGLSLDPGKFSAMNLTLTSGVFYIWSNQEVSDQYAATRDSYETNTSWSQRSKRSNSKVYAFCVD